MRWAALPDGGTIPVKSWFLRLKRYASGVETRSHLREYSRSLPLVGIPIYPLLKRVRLLLAGTPQCNHICPMTSDKNSMALHECLVFEALFLINSQANPLNLHQIFG